MSVVSAYVSYKKSKYALFHAIQGGILNILFVIFLQIQTMNAETAIASLIFLMSWVLAIISFVSIVILMFASFFAKSKWRFPLIGKLADYLAEKWYSPTSKGGD